MNTEQMKIERTTRWPLRTKPLRTQMATHFAKLDDGAVVPYDACNTSRDASWDAQFRPDVFEYIGHGVIHTVNGVNQNSTRPMHFWKRVASNEVPIQES